MAFAVSQCAPPRPAPDPAPLNMNENPNVHRTSLSRSSSLSSSGRLPRPGGSAVFSRAALGVFGTCVGLGLALGGALRMGPPVESIESGAEIAAQRDKSVARSVSSAFEQVADKVAPAVVRIESFNVLGGVERRLGQGSGVILKAEGLIATNAHVVSRATRLRVSLVDGRAFEAEVVGLDEETDLAVIRIDADGLVSAPLRTDEPARVGEWVIAIGNPLGLSHAVTAGIVSGRGRTASITTYEDFIQTDAAINPGNSGGPLVDLDGRVIGINTAVADVTRGGQGIGFAIPATMVAGVVEQLAESGRVTRGYMGVRLNEVSDSYVRSRGYRGSSRVIIASAESGTPAASAGVKSGEIIDSIDGNPVSSLRGLMSSIARLRPGTDVKLALVSAGERRIVTINLTERPLLGK